MIGDMTTRHNGSSVLWRADRIGRTATARGKASVAAAADLCLGYAPFAFHRCCPVSSWLTPRLALIVARNLCGTFARAAMNQTE